MFLSNTVLCRKFDMVVYFCLRRLFYVMSVSLRETRSKEQENSNDGVSNRTIQCTRVGNTDANWLSVSLRKSNPVPMNRFQCERTPFSIKHNLATYLHLHAESPFSWHFSPIPKLRPAGTRHTRWTRPGPCPSAPGWDRSTTEAFRHPADANPASTVPRGDRRRPLWYLWEEEEAKKKPRPYQGSNGQTRIWVIQLKGEGKAYYVGDEVVPIYFPSFHKVSTEMSSLC